MKKNWKKYLPIAGFALVLTLAAALTLTSKAKSVETDTIPERVYFGDISVGGMTRDEAKAAAEGYIQELQDKNVTIQAGENTLEAKASDLGISWGNQEIVEEAAGLGKSGNLIARYKAKKDLEKEDKVYKLAFAVDKNKIKQLLENHADTLNTKAVDAGLKRESGAFSVIPGSQGVTVNVEKSTDILEKFFTTEWDGEDAAVEITAEVVDPKGTAEELSKVKDVLGTFHTSYGSSAAGRSKNVQNGAERINGSVIYPGDTFSVYEAVSPFTKANGYELAGSYENGTTVETYGGGICQVSTTLYNAVIRAELEIVERFAHSMTVSYVEKSADAAIAGTYKDLKFKNNTKAPIYIEGYTQGKVIYFTIYGEETRPSNRKVEFVSETLSTTDMVTEYREDSGMAVGKRSSSSGHTGYTARLWKVVTVDGVEQSRDIFNKSSYQMSPKTVTYGTASANPEATNAMRAAIATQDQGTIDATAAQWNDEALAAQQAAAQQQAEQQQQQPPSVDPAGTGTPEGTQTTP